MSNQVNITSTGIKKVLRLYNEQQSLAEYIWNGFDARADTIHIDYAHNELGTLESLSVSDNGYGINFSLLKDKFNPFYESEKAIEQRVHRHKSTMHGKNGVGRLTFFTFAYDAEWNTTYEDNGVFKNGSIKVSGGLLNDYDSRLLEENMGITKTGTTVSFSNIKISKEDLEQVIIPYLQAEFCWFLELNKNRGFSIVINGTPLSYEDNILDYDDQIEFRYPESQTLFKVKFIQWKESVHKELSKNYFINRKGEEVHKDYTTLNKKADEYYHSVFIESEFFEEFDFSSTEHERQVKLYSRTKSAPEYKFLIKQVNALLRSRRKPFLKEFSSRLIDKFESDGLLPKYSNPDDPKRVDFIETLKVIYEIQPKLFSGLSIDQKKTLFGLISVLLNSSGRDQLFHIIAGVVELEQEEQEELASFLGTSTKILV
ncbi:putative DNA mismatch repair protein [Pedobacter sp. BAL39]|uniref:ATP-binding protein n=1 Tax=Pedobacter sp. BAL39 TaxID=391596 RepID=UPI0001559CE2|nr:ATP-binding protein [Pedobacter sp. BAL39]EDM36738.1 putative DNA mismatch repair protein [Pedobacter sp. BAL39]